MSVFDRVLHTAQDPTDPGPNRPDLRVEFRRPRPPLDRVSVGVRFVGIFSKKKPEEPTRNGILLEITQEEMENLNEIDMKRCLFSTNKHREV